MTLSSSTQRTYLKEDIMVIVASTLIAKCHGMHGVEVESTATIEQIDPAQYDGIVAV